MRYELHFRSTVGAWGEVSPASYVLAADLYPVTRNGLTYGWSTAPTSADVATPGSAKLSGRNAMTQTTASLRVDLPDGPGKYRVWLGLGIGAGLTTGFEIRDTDNTTVLASLTGATITNAQVADATGAIFTFANWLSSNSSLGGGAYVEFTTTGSSFFVRRNTTNSLYLSHLAFEIQAEPLDPAVLTNEDGTGTAASIYAKEPFGKLVGRITSPKGAQTFSVVGAAATYFSVVTLDGFPYLAATSTRLPASYSSGITIRQTTTGETKDTTVFPTIIDPGSRQVDGSILGQISSQTWLERQRVLDKSGEEWTGYVSGSFVSDLTANSTAALASAYAGITPNGTGWYRIRCQDGGDWTGALTLGPKDFGTGGLLIEPDAGHDPLLNFYTNGLLIKGLHWRGLRMCPPEKSISNGRMLEHSNVAGTPYLRMKVSNCRIGYMQKPGETVANWNNWGYFVYGMFCEQIILKDNVFDGLFVCAVMSGGRHMISEGNDFKRIATDVHAFSPAYRFTTPRGVFADDESYVRIRNNTVRFNPDIYTGISGSGTPHGDFFQIRRTEGYPFTARPNNNGSATWSVGGAAFVVASGNLYRVASITTGVADANNPPTGTGTGIVSGGVTFDFNGNYPLLATEFNVLLEGNVCLADGASVNLDGNASPNIQFAINSNAGYGNLYRIAAVNNICASGNSRGIVVGSDCEVHAEFNTFVAGAVMPVVSGSTIGLDQACISAAKVRARKNIVGRKTAGGPNVLQDTGTPYSEDNVTANFAKTATVGERPGDVMRGAFAQNAASDWGFPTIQDDGQNTAAAFVSDMSKQLHHMPGAAGAKLREVHTVTISDSAGHSTTRDLVIAP